MMAFATSIALTTWNNMGEQELHTLINTLTKIADQTESKSTTWWLIWVLLAFGIITAVSVIWLVRYFITSMKEQRDHHKAATEDMTKKNSEVLLKVTKDNQELSTRYIASLEIGNKEMTTVMVNVTNALNDARLEAVENRRILGDIAAKLEDRS